jgi:hypothetical protein
VKQLISYLCGVMFKYIVTLFLIGMFIRFLLRYILPIFRITSAANGQMKQMQEKMKAMEEKMNPPSPQQARKVKKEGDYIDYEEVK